MEFDLWVMMIEPELRLLFKYVNWEGIWRVV